MADISSITLPNSSTYNFKDASARSSIAGKQDSLVSGTNIKTIQTASILGSGNISFVNAKSVVTITPSTDTVYSMTSAGSVSAGSSATLTFAIDTSDSSQLNISFTQNTPTSVTLPGRSNAKTVWIGYQSGIDSTYAAAQAISASGADVIGNANGEAF